MQPISPVFERLQLSAYIDVFVENGFDTWEDVLDITESDLESLNVRLGHRRRLQREIADYTGRSIKDIIGDNGDRQSSLDPPGDTRDAQPVNPGQNPATGKRRYRRHPKPDPNAPERPPSAYVLFSNQVREDLKAENLSFTEMAKVVGEKWQQLNTDGREPYETEASDMKDAYNAKLIDYKKTPEYKEYAEYLTNFKAAQQSAASGQASEGKRVKLERSGDGSHNSSRESQGTPTTSTHGSPVSTSTLVMQPNLTDATRSSLSSPTAAQGYSSIYNSSVTGRSSTSSRNRSLGSESATPDHGAPYTSQHSLPPLSNDLTTRMLPRRNQHAAPSYLRTHRDAQIQSPSQVSGASFPSGSAYGPTNPLDRVQGTIPAPGTESGTPYSQHHGLKSLTLTGYQDRSSSAIPSPIYGHSGAPSPVHPPYSGPEASSRVLPPLGQPGATTTQQQQQRMDGLSVLALAGRMVDGDREHNPNRDIPKPGPM